MLCLINFPILQPKLPGTIFTAAKEIEAAGGKCLPCIVDVRDEAQVKAAVKSAVEKFGGIDIVINNASAISQTAVGETDMKRYDLMHNINTRGTFLVTRECLPYLKKSSHAHVLTNSPPLIMDSKWFSEQVAYTISKFGMSMCVLGMSEEFAKFNIGVNAIWPQKIVHTAAIDMIRGPENAKFARKVDIMADAAYAILIRDPKTCTGNFYIDEQVLAQEGIIDLKPYNCVPGTSDEDLIDCFFNDEPSATFLKPKPKL